MFSGLHETKNNEQSKCGARADRGYLFEGRNFPEWQREFKALVSESDSTKLPERLQTAKTAIGGRLRAKREHPLGTLERIALNDAIQLLQVLRSEGLPQSW